MQSTEEDLDDWDYDCEDDWDDVEEDLQTVKKSSVDAYQMFTVEDKPYKLFVASTIADMQKERIEQISDDIGLSEDLAYALLLVNGWQLEQTKEAFGADPEYLNKTFKFELSSEELDKSEPFLCPCCYCEYEDHENEVVRMEDCGHALCINCFTGHLEAKLSDGPDCIFAKCPDIECNNIVPPRIFKQLLSREKYTRYKLYQVNSFVDTTKKRKWCPGRDCNKIVEQKEALPINIECDCGHTFCFGCVQEAHMPISCDLL